MNPQRCVMAMIGLILTGLAVGCSTSGPAPEGTSGAVESRGLPLAKQPPAAPQPMQEPTWPQRFEVSGPEIDSFGFAVTQPGQVVVVVQALGAPVVVSLHGPAPQPISQQGSREVRLTYSVTPQDVQKSLFWGVQIRLAQPMPPAQGGRASGSVMVQHPPVNVAQVQAAVAAQQQAAQQQVAQRQAQEQQVGAQVAAQIEAAFQQRKAQFEQQRRQRHAALMAGVQPALDRMRARGQGRIGTRGIEGTEAAAGEPRPQGTEDIGTRGLSPDQMMGITRLQLQTVVPNPTITSLSVAQGQPSDPVMITGSGFSNDGGEVHFIINPGKDVVAHVDFWSDTQLFVTVPDATGIQWTDVRHARVRQGEEQSPAVSIQPSAGASRGAMDTRSKGEMAGRAGLILAPHDHCTW